MIFIECIKKIPTEIIINNILPYTYETKPTDLLLDIISFRTDYNIIINLYAFSYNYRILLFDLIYFCNNSIHIDDSITLKLQNVLKRNFILSQFSNDQLLYFIYTTFHEKRRNTLSQIKFIWGLLTLHERNEFINRLIE
jgi:hypothetical protein